MTWTIALNVALGVGLVTVLVLLLGHYGVNKDRGRRRHLARHHGDVRRRTAAS